MIFIGKFLPRKRLKLNIYFQLFLLFSFCGSAISQTSSESFVDLNGDVFRIPNNYLTRFSGSTSSASHPIKVNYFTFAYQMPNGDPPPVNVIIRPIDEIGANGSFSVTVHNVERWTGVDGEYAGRYFANALMWQGIDAYNISGVNGLIRADPISNGIGQMIWLLGTKQIQLEDKIFWVSSLTSCEKIGDQCVSDIYINQMRLKIRILFFKGHIENYWPIAQKAVILLNRWISNSR